MFFGNFNTKQNSTPNSKPGTRNSEPETQNPEPKTRTDTRFRNSNYCRAFVAQSTNVLHTDKMDHGI